MVEVEEKQQKEEKEEKKDERESQVISNFKMEIEHKNIHRT